MALLPPFYLDCIVAIGFGEDPATRAWIGTGFLCGRVASTDSEGNKNYRLFLVTNKHVLSDLKKVYLKFNSALDISSKDYPLTLIARNGRKKWVGHPDDDVDVAAAFLNAGFLKQEQRKYQYVALDVHAMPKSKMKSEGVTEGDRVFVLGFPMGLVDAVRQYVICRGGIIARIRDFIEGKSKDYLVDATVFPGNSGGPVIICPSALSTGGTKPIANASLIGIVKSYIPYSDLAFSSQTKRPRMVFEENSGLAAVESSDSILETVELCFKRIKGRAARAKRKAKEKSKK